MPSELMSLQRIRKPIVAIFAKPFYNNFPLVLLNIEAARRSRPSAEVVMSMPGPLEMGVILLVVLLLFGTKRLPEIGRALGEGIREFKKSLRDASEKKPEDKQNP